MLQPAHEASSSHSELCVHTLPGSPDTDPPHQGTSKPDTAAGKDTSPPPPLHKTRYFPARMIRQGLSRTLYVRPHRAQGLPFMPLLALIRSTKLLSYRCTQKWPPTLLQEPPKTNRWPQYTIPCSMALLGREHSSITAVLQLLPTREELDSMITRLEADLKQDIVDLQGNVSTLSSRI